MSTSLPPVPHQSPMTDNSGRPLPVWSDWFKQMFARVGGNSANSNTEIDAEITALSPRLVPTGTMLSFAGSTAPTGFLSCDGSAVSRTTYSALFAAIGTVWGVGDGSTTFNLPDMRGRFPVGKSASGTFTTIGGTGGAESVNLPDHAHGVSLSTGTPSATTTVQSGVGATVASSGHTHGLSGNTGNPNTSPAIATLPPYAALLMVIKI